MGLLHPKVLNIKQAQDMLDAIIDGYEAGDNTIYPVGKWGREAEVYIMPYDLYKSLVEMKEALDAKK